MVKNTKDEDIFFGDDTPEILPEEFVNNIVSYGFKEPVSKRQVRLRIDGDVLDWFKSQGKGYQTRINSLLHAYMKANCL
ncbi:MAG: BrnA antitoxin family protein [Proteobacteria bacterium]|nr:BrnA antitoxin family protein [Pseudomonadota bacterium]